MAVPRTIRVGHRGADSLVPGNTLASFRAAVEEGVDVIELDVVWEPEAGGDADGTDRTPLMVAHDLGDLASREHPTLAETLEAFGRPPLDQVEIDIDLKLAGREREIAAAVRDAGLAGRTMFSGMEVESIEALAAVAPDMRRGWTLPRITRDPRQRRFTKVFVRPAMKVIARRLPRLISRRAAHLGVWSVWVFHGLITERLVAAAHAEGIAVFAWTVDSAERQRELVAIGVDGLVSNDPRLFAESLDAVASERPAA